MDLKLIELAEALARSLGHTTICMKSSTPCTCGCGEQQAQALYEYEKWKDSKKEK